MAEALKDGFNRDTVRRIGAELAAACGSFDQAAFAREASRFGDLGLTERARHVTTVLRRRLPQDVPAALDVIVRSLAEPLDRTEDFGFSVFRYLPHAYFIADYGLDHVEESLAAMHALTQRFTAEFTVRPFLERHTARTLEALHHWTDDPSPHVRRLVSEGTRPRLPWASRLAVFLDDPTPVIALLERLRDDPSDYVRRSVANHLNDLSRSHSTLVLELAERWMAGAPEARRSLVRHALRTLVKAGDPRALRAIGAGLEARARVEGELSAQRRSIGESIKVTVTLTNQEATPAHFVVDLAVHFVRADGETRAKVFKLRSVTLAAGASAALSRTISLRQHTTRTHYPGAHAVEAIVNGTRTPIGAFTLRA